MMQGSQAVQPMQADQGEKLEFFATCGAGLEELVAQEARELGLSNIRPLVSGVSFRATVQQACRAMLWMRCASRVQLVLARVAAADAQQLYDGCRELPWENHVATDATIAVFARGSNAQLRNTQFVSQRVKDAVCDRLVELEGWRPSVDTKNPKLAIRVTVHADKATISLDLSGAPLHERGYRTASAQVEAPIKETLAAAIVLAGGWPAIAREGGAFCDPFCGGGTLAIEAAMICGDVAPQILRQRWGIQGWRQFDQSVLDALLDEADQRAEQGLAAMPSIYASDIDKHAVASAQANAKAAGVGGKISFACCDVAHLPWSDLPQRGLVACNPPYGERLLSQSQLPSLITAVHQLATSAGPDWAVSMIVADDTVDSLMEAAPTTLINTFNGPIAATIRAYAPSGDDPYAALPQDIAAQTQEFANRLHKMARIRRKWAKRTGVTCYRVYDADLPDFALAVDVYQGAGRDSGTTWAHVSEYKAPKTIDSNVATARASSALAAIRHEFDLDASDIYFKRREQAKGGSQYSETGGDGTTHLVAENGHLFQVSFTSHLDTGIFLDSRPIRQLIEQEAAGKSFLNLFAYTGTATVYAAAGGARSTLTVDMSQTYLQWAQVNMELNSFVGERYEYERADVVRWLQDTRHSTRRFDLVYIDPPTFSNSKKMRASWDVQRDHVELLIDVSRILTPTGKAVFCCNLRNFKPDLEALQHAGVEMEDITEQTIPEDFARTPNVHHCYLLKRVETQAQMQNTQRRREQREAADAARRTGSAAGQRRGGGSHREDGSSTGRSGGRGNGGSGYGGKRDGERSGGRGGGSHNQRGGGSNRQGGTSRRGGKNNDGTVSAQY